MCFIMERQPPKEKRLAPKAFDILPRTFAPSLREGARPRAPRRRAPTEGCISVLDYNRRLASITIRQLPDEDAIPPHARLGTR
jgi:hypothetical protein